MHYTKTATPRGSSASVSRSCMLSARHHSMSKQRFTSSWTRARPRRPCSGECRSPQSCPSPLAPPTVSSCAYVGASHHACFRRLFSALVRDARVVCLSRCASISPPPRGSTFVDDREGISVAPVSAHACVRRRMWRSRQCVPRILAARPSDCPSSAYGGRVAPRVLVVQCPCP